MWQEAKGEGEEMGKETLCTKLSVSIMGGRNGQGRVGGGRFRSKSKFAGTWSSIPRESIANQWHLFLRGPAGCNSNMF